MNFTLETKVPPDARFASLIARVAEDAAWRAEFGAAARASIVRAAALGFETIVRDAITDGGEPIRLVATCTPEHLQISLFERGMPIDDASSRSNPDWTRIAQDVDTMHWALHGRRGAELQLRVARPHGLDVSEDHPPVREEDVPLAPPQSYTIRRFKPADAPGVARAFYLTYGYNYTFPPVYVPERLTQLNESGRYVSIVAVAKDGEIAGHYAMRGDDGTPVAEGCGAIVVPAHRGRDLVRSLREAAEREAERAGFAAYYTEPVTGHGRTQHESESFGAQACALSLGMSPPTMLAKNMELTARGQRQSFLLYFKPLRRRERRTIYAPPRHRAIIERIYKNLQLDVDFDEGAAPPPGSGTVRTAIERADGEGTIWIESVGASTAGVVRQAVSDLRSLGHIGALFLLLPLEDSAAPQLCEEIEACGFYFSGLGPWMLDGRDALRMQMPLTPIDTSQLTIVGEFARELRDYVEKSASAAT